MAEQTEITPEQFEQAVANLQETVAGSAGRFYWIAGVSLVNTILTLLNTNLIFPTGLTTTMISDEGLASGDSGAGLKIFCVVFNLISYGIFALFGLFAKRRQQWAFITGFVLYTLDTLLLALFLLFGDFNFFIIINGVFHVWLLFAIFQGIKANGLLKKLETMAGQAELQSQSVIDGPILPPPPYPQPETPSDQPSDPPPPPSQ
jgi:hypothetical protein